MFLLVIHIHIYLPSSPYIMAHQHSPFLDAVQKLIPDVNVQLAFDAGEGRLRAQIQHLLSHRKLPDDGWDDRAVSLLLQMLSSLDSNNALSVLGAGEREGRVYSKLVADRHYCFSHGIGRSGDIKAQQPKAVGSSVVNVLTNALALDAIRVSGITSCKAAFVQPTATSLAITMCLLRLRLNRPNANRVIWMRCDQKACFKAIAATSLEAQVVEPVIEGDELHTNLEDIVEVIEEFGHESIVCVLSTTSCFAPRMPDKLEEVARICDRYGVPHLVNNAYGLQCSKCTHAIEQASKIRLDLFVQSTDKNFMVPVGGSIIAGFDATLVDSVAQTYPGRASGSPSIDLLITLLQMGKKGYVALLRQRKDNYVYLKEELMKVAEKHGERVLQTPRNGISLAFSTERHDGSVGSKLFTRGITGARSVSIGGSKTIDGYSFANYGAHCSAFSVPYINFAAGIGIEKREIDGIVKKLDKCLGESQVHVTADSTTTAT